MQDHPAGGKDDGEDQERERQWAEQLVLAEAVEPVGKVAD